MRTTELVIEWGRRIKIGVKGLDSYTTAVILIIITLIFVIGSCLIVVIPVWITQ